MKRCGRRLIAHCMFLIMDWHQRNPDKIGTLDQR